MESRKFRRKSQVSILAALMEQRERLARHCFQVAQWLWQACLLLNPYTLWRSEDFWAKCSLWYCALRSRFMVDSGEKPRLLEWVRTKVPRARQLNNLTSDWKDGILLCALLEALVPGSCPRYDLLNPENAPANAQMAVNLIQRQLGVKSPITAEEVITCQPGSERKLMVLLSQLRLASAKHILRPTATIPIIQGADKNDDSRFLPNQECAARGMGLVLAVKGRKACFNIFLKSTVQLNIVIEIRGPENTLCSERITNRSPKRKPPIKSSLLASLGSYDGNSKNSRTNSTPSSLVEEQKTVKIPFEYEVMSGKVSVGYIPVVTGKHRLSIIWQGQHIMGSPYTVSVDESGDSQLDAKAKPTRLLAGQYSSLQDQSSTPPSTPVSTGNTYAFSSNSRSPSRSPTLGTVTRRRVLHHIIKVDGKDIVIEDSNPEAFASAVQALSKREAILSKRSLTRHISLDFKKDSVQSNGGSCFPTVYEVLDINDNKSTTELIDLDNSKFEAGQSPEGDFTQRPRTKSAPESILRNSPNGSPRSTRSPRGSPKTSGNRGVYFDDESSERSMSMSSGVNSDDGPIAMKSSLSDSKLSNDVFAEDCEVDSSTKELDTEDEKLKLSTSKELKQWFKVIEDAKTTNKEVNVDKKNQENKDTQSFIIPKIVEDAVHLEESCDGKQESVHSKDDCVTKPKMTRKVAVVRSLDNDQINQLYLQRTSAEMDSVKASAVCSQTKELVASNDTLNDESNLSNGDVNTRQVHLEESDITSTAKRHDDEVTCANDESKLPNEVSPNSAEEPKSEASSSSQSEVLPNGHLSKNESLCEVISPTRQINGSTYEEQFHEAVSSPSSLPSDQNRKNSDCLSKTDEENASEEWVVVSETEEQNYVVELTNAPYLNTSDTVKPQSPSVENRKQELEKISASARDQAHTPEPSIVQSQEYHHATPIRSLSSNISLDESPSPTQASCFPSRTRSQDNFSPSRQESDISTFSKTKEFWEKNDVSRSVPDFFCQKLKLKNDVKNPVNVEGFSSVRERRLFWENFSESPKKTSVSTPRSENTWQVSEPSQSYESHHQKDQDEAKERGSANVTTALVTKTSELKPVPAEQPQEDKNSSIQPRLGSPGSEGTVDSGVSLQYLSPTPTERRGRSISVPSPPRNLSFCPRDAAGAPLTLIYRQNPLFSLDSSRRYDTSFVDENSVTDTSFTEMTDDRGYIDDEIPDYASILMDKYVSFTGLLENDHCMSRREMMGFDFKPESELFKSHVYHEPVFKSDASVHLPRPAACRARGSGVYYGQVGTRNHFQVVTRGAGKGCLTVSVQGPGQHDVNEVVIAYAGDQAYEVMYDVAEPGYYVISVKWSDWNIPESPFICKVTF